LPLTIEQNALPKGFGANHNAAFARSRGEYFCVANPDIRLEANPFPALLRRMQDHRVGVAAPLVVGPDGSPEDNARRFPTPARLARKLLHRSGPNVEYPQSSEPMEPDWVAGMFMLFRHEAFARVGGFDERYFLYYEDVDLCARLRLAGLTVVLEPAARVIHHAQRQSRRSLRYAWWHARSMARWLCSRSRRRVARLLP
jgi:GT2 family glycosyltransferase